ncbi:uncharacterized protein AMSG_05937 [Thecamonas trahens ATCC 50062]|uniref:Uncharacterized protein n=1 Tax=Thecamonas trahens ATCC 50062 TaxID=461836 RepID=A0A0L0DBS1_THETB|nr:hypothetical protein AMSG_05937 [Thecamonas trahens ATCC 50062]KNC49675.1 hypothetical protein AMSG_05937 [Thecamonas trahens ATCC 50062]|eukprot:XP_013757472.1 hypothetical protein AMSG_05937 [Thecamonas trahens ATCC 50062]
MPVRTVTNYGELLELLPEVTTESEATWRYARGLTRTLASHASFGSGRAVVFNTRIRSGRWVAYVFAWGESAAAAMANAVEEMDEFGCGEVFVVAAMSNAAEQMLQAEVAMDAADSHPCWTRARACMPEGHTPALLPDGYTARKLEPADIDALLPTWKYSDGVSHDWIKAIMGDLASVGVFASDGSLAGSMVEYPDGSCGMLHTAEGHRRRGLARYVVDAMAAQLAAAGRSCMFVTIETYNEASLSLFDSLGFCDAGRVAWVFFANRSAGVMAALAESAEAFGSFSASDRLRTLAGLQRTFAAGLPHNTKARRLASAARVTARWPDVFSVLANWIKAAWLERAADELHQLLAFVWPFIMSNKPAVKSILARWDVVEVCRDVLVDMPGSAVAGSAAAVISKLISNGRNCHDRMLGELVVSAVIDGVAVADRVWPLRILYSMSFDSRLVPALLALDPRPLIQAVICEETDSEGIVVRAAILAANLYGGPDASALLGEKAESCVAAMVAAGEATLIGAAYPASSGSFFGLWKILAGIDALATHEPAAKALGRCGAVRLVAAALASDATAGDSRVLIHGVAALWSLSFVAANGAAIAADAALVMRLEELAAGGASQPRSVVRAARGVVWQMSAASSGPARKSAGKSSSDTLQHDVMISYSWANQKVALWLRAQLAVAGISVWIDVEAMSGSTLEAMAEAIESSRVVVVLLSQEYSVSQACRVEAEYCFQLGKPFVPVKATPRFRPRGWLGALIGSRLYFHPTPDSWPDMHRELMTILERPSESVAVVGAASASASTCPAVASASEWVAAVGLSDPVGCALARAHITTMAQIDELAAWRMHASTTLSAWTEFVRAELGLALCDALSLGAALRERLS